MCVCFVEYTCACFVEYTCSNFVRNTSAGKQAQGCSTFMALKFSVLGSASLEVKLLNLSSSKRLCSTAIKSVMSRSFSLILAQRLNHHIVAGVW